MKQERIREDQRADPNQARERRTSVETEFKALGKEFEEFENSRLTVLYLLGCR